MEKYINADLKVHVLSMQFRVLETAVKSSCPTQPSLSLTFVLLCPESNLVDELHK